MATHTTELPVPAVSWFRFLADALPIIVATVTCGIVWTTTSAPTVDTLPTVFVVLTAAVTVLVFACTQRIHGVVRWALAGGVYLAASALYSNHYAETLPGEYWVYNIIRAFLSVAAPIFLLAVGLRLLVALVELVRYSYRHYVLHGTLGLRSVFVAEVGPRAQERGTGGVWLEFLPWVIPSVAYFTLLVVISLVGIYKTGAVQPQEW